MGDSEDLQKRAAEALAKGEPIPDFPTALQGETSGVNELYINFVNSGFTSQQAIYLCGCIITGNPGAIPPSTD